MIREEVKKILMDPAMGELKKDPLAGVRVHKFTIRRQQHLLAYEVEPSSHTVYLYALGTHEKFYEALQRYLHS